MNHEILKNIGLSKNEIKCYLTLLRLGSASANEISRLSGVHRVSIYDSLRALREKGLVSQITKANKLLFEASNPKKISEIIKEKEEELQAAKENIPELLTVFNAAKNKQEIHSYKGLSGIKTILQDMLSSSTEILDFGAEFKIKDFLPYDYPKWDKERCTKKVFMRIIANKKIKPVSIPKAEIKYASHQTQSSVSTYIYDNKVAMIMWVEHPLGVIIEHKEVYHTYKQYFELLWKASKK